MSTSLQINGKSVTVNAEPDTPLLWVIRDTIGLSDKAFMRPMRGYIHYAMTPAADFEPDIDIRGRHPAPVVDGRERAGAERPDRDLTHRARDRPSLAARASPCAA